MKQAKFFLVIITANFSLWAMEKPVTIDSDKPGIFLETVVSEYENPFTVNLMYLRSHPSGNCWVDEDMSRHSSKVLAVAWGQKTLIKVPEIETRIKFTPYQDDKFATIREIACLRVEDVVTKAKADVWIRKYLKFHENRHNKRGHFFVNGKVIESFDFDHDQFSHTKFTLQIPKKKLAGQDIVVTSKTASLGRKYVPDNNEWFLP